VRALPLGREQDHHAGAQPLFVGRNRALALATASGRAGREIEPRGSEGDGNNGSTYDD
jgi:hypothetical protein